MFLWVIAMSSCPVKMLIDHPYRLYSLWLSIREVGTLEYGDFCPHLLFLSIIPNNFYHVLHYLTSFNLHSNRRLGTIIIPILQLRSRRLREDKSFPEFTQLVSSRPGFKLELHVLTCRLCTVQLLVTKTVKGSRELCSPGALTSQSA